MANACSLVTGWPPGFVQAVTAPPLVCDPQLAPCPVNMVDDVVVTVKMGLHAEAREPVEVMVQTPSAPVPLKTPPACVHKFSFCEGHASARAP